jgi:hypothetical protein
MPIEQPWNGKVKVGDRLRIDKFCSMLRHVGIPQAQRAEYESAFALLDGKEGAVVKVIPGKPILNREDGTVISFGSADSYEVKLDTVVVINGNKMEIVPTVPNEVTLIEEAQKARAS